jgi:hypothetical protein
VSDSKYFQFPLCVLSYGKNPRERISEMISWCCVSTGENAAEKMDQYALAGMTERLIDKIGERAKDFDEENEAHINCLLGADILSVRLGSFAIPVSEYRRVETHIARQRAEHGPDPLVRIRADIVWDALHERLPYREFAVLCALYSVIGDKDGPVRITRETIRARALGYKNGAVAPRAPYFRPDGMKGLTERILKDTIEKLQARGFFVKVNPSKTEAYFSHRMTRKELADAVIKVKSKRLALRADIAAENERIRRELGLKWSAS